MNNSLNEGISTPETNPLRLSTRRDCSAEPYGTAKPVKYVKIRDAFHSIQSKKLTQIE